MFRRPAGPMEPGRGTRVRRTQLPPFADPPLHICCIIFDMVAAPPHAQSRLDREECSYFVLDSCVELSHTGRCARRVCAGPALSLVLERKKGEAMAGAQLARSRAPETMDEFVARRNREQARREADYVARQDRWSASTRTGQNHSAVRPGDVVVLGAQARSACSESNQEVVGSIRFESDAI